MLKMTMWGTRGSVPSGGSVRYGGATTCLEVELEGGGAGTPSRVIIDCGTGLAELGRRWGGRGSAALMLQTHMHWDHVQGFPFFRPLFDPKNRFDFWSARREGKTLKEVFSGQMSGPMFPIGMDAMPAELTFRTLPEMGSAELGELSLSWTEVSHPSGSTAYRLEYRGASMVFTGDVELENEGRERLLSFAKGADLLVMDAQYFPDEYLSRRGFGHSTPTGAVALALEAGVGELMMTHHDPGHSDDRLDEKLSMGRRAAQGQLRVGNARDGLTWSPEVRS